MTHDFIKRNERDWSGQLISWIKSAIEKRMTVFQDATNDTGVKLESGKTKYPDILLFIDKTSGIVFNGWELKFPDTPVDDHEMLVNALEKAKRLQSDSFVTWNGSETIIWKIDKENYSLETLSKLKTYPPIASISSREDLAEPSKYAANEAKLKKRALEILHDLGLLYLNGHLKPAINISGNIIYAIKKAANIIIPQFQKAIEEEKGTNKNFRDEFAKWKIYESSTIKILEYSSRKDETVIPEQVLAKFTFYNLIGKTIFYLTLSENLSGELEAVRLSGNDMKALLHSYFEKAKEIDYQAIFKPYFTDGIRFSETTNTALQSLLTTLTNFDFNILPTSVIGYILENLVPTDERQKFGQYFTPEILADLVAYPAIKTKNDLLFDPTSGTGTFLISFYKTLKHFGQEKHSDLLNQIWGNDVSHFPAILSVINLYKQDVTETDNFPRVIREDFFNLEVGKNISFPDPHNHKRHVDVKMPLFDGIVSNFPFIQQEDIPNEKLTALFRLRFQNAQQAFMKDDTFKVNERSDYFTYCIYNSIRFLKPDGCIAGITSNAWLGKEYGLQFKKFLLDNFHIKYIVKSNAEHWFKDSQVSTIYFVAERGHNDAPTRFVTINVKLDEYFCKNDDAANIQKIEDWYAQIDYCDDINNKDWRPDTFFSGLHRKKDGAMNVCIVPKKTLKDSLISKGNWGEFFISTDLFGCFEKCLIQYFPKITNVFRGERTGWNDMFIIKDKDIPSTKIASKYLIPYIKKPSELKQMEFGNNYKYKLFVCKEKSSDLDDGTKAWIRKFQNAKNKNGSKTIKEACESHRPYWFSLNPKHANIVTAINPYERYFFTYSKKAFAIDQRLIAMEVQEGYDVELIAALLNSAITFLTLEMRGTSRNLGALDLNANYLKSLKALNPDLLSSEQKYKILKAFEPLKRRNISNITDEINNPARIAFDKVVFRCFGLDETLLPHIYALLSTTVNDRVSMNKR